MKNLVFLALLLLPALAFAQQPKLHLKFFGGTNSHRFVYRTDSIDSDNLFGYQFGFGFRVSRRQLFGEIDFSFTRFGATLIPAEDTGLEDDINARINSFELPLNVGYIPVKKPVFKWYLYSGLVNRFSVRGLINFGDEQVKFKPKEVNLPIYNLDVQIGTQIDIAWLNLDVHYKIGVTNALHEDIRTNLRGLYLSAGFIF